jgi:PAS domain S-box-containing protein
MELQLEIAERKQAEETLDRVNRALKTLSECNQAMVRTTEESELLEEICRALVEVGGYRLAWVGFAEMDEAKTVRPVSHAGYEDGYLDIIDVTWADNERGHGPVGTAIRTGQMCVTRNTDNDINFAVWRDEAIKRGYASVIALPLFTNGQVLGSLNICAPEPDAFDAEEVKQLTELADDLSFGITALRTRAEQKRAEEELRLKAQMLDAATDSIMLYDPKDGSFVYVNEATCKSRGYTRDELMRMKRQELSAPEARRLSKGHRLKEVLEKGHLFFESIHQRKDGTTMPVEANVHVIETGGRKLVLSVTRDITARKQAEELYTTLANSSPISVYILQDRKFVFTNPKFQNDTGYTDKELLDIEPALTVYPEDRERYRQNSIEMLRGQSLQPYEYRYITKTGKIGWALERVISITYNGKQAILGTTMDITERKQAEELYTTLADNSPIGVYIYQGGRFVYTNPAFKKATSYTDDDLVGKDSPWLVYHEDREITRKNAIEILKGKRIQPYEFRYTTKTGETRWALERVSSITYEGKRATLGNFMDITERKQAEQLYYNLAESSPVGVYIVQDRKFVFANPAFYEATGYASDDLLGRDPAIIIHPKDRESVRLNAIDMLKGKRTQPYEFRFITKSGETRWALERASSITYDGGQATLGNFLDMTELKQAMRAQQESEEKLRLMFQAVTDGIVITDMNGDILDVNERMLQMFGLQSRDDAVGKSAFGFIVPRHRDLARKNSLSTLKQGATKEIEYTLLKGDGDEFPGEASVSPLKDASGRSLGFIIVVRDITERRRMQEQLVLTDRLASIGELAAGIAHELNNPLAGVIGLSQLLLEKTIPVDIQDDLKIICSEAQRASHVVKNLLMFARKHSIVKAPVDVTEVLDKVLVLRAYEQKVNNIEVIKQFAPDLPKIPADYFQLQQVFLNIIINAEYFMTEAHHRGKLIINAERIDDFVRISFADDGPGITRENIAHLFDPFFTTKEVGKGTGLGLSICHGIVISHGGRIYAQSEFGKGATFTIELPLTERQEEREAIG